MCVGNPDRTPVRIQSRHAAPTPSGFAEIVSDDFPVLHAADSAAFLHYSCSHGAVIRVYDEAGNVIETHEHRGDFKEL